MKRSLAILPLLLALLANQALAETDPASAIYEESGIQGGLVVELGFVDAEYTVELGAPDAVTLQTLSADPHKVVSARKELEAKGLYGKITVERLDGKRLPYADNLVNLIVLHDKNSVSGGGEVSRGEIMRVLAPGGVFCSEAGRSGRTELQIARKPWPKEIDQWTHFLHSAAGNAVAADQRVAPATALVLVSLSV